MDYIVLFHNSLRNKGNRLKGVSEDTVNHWVGQADFMGENYLLRRKGSQPLNRQSLHTDRKSKSAYTKQTAKSNQKYIMKTNSYGFINTTVTGSSLFCLVL